MTEQSRFFKDTFIYTLGGIIGGFLGYLFHFIIARKLSVDQYGELQSLISLLMVAGVLATALRYFVIKYFSAFVKAKDSVSNALFLKFLGKRLKKPLILLFLGSLILMPLIRSYLHLTDYWGLILIIIAMIFSILGTLYIAILTAWKRFFSISFVGVFSAFVKLVIGILLVFAFPRASYLMVAFLLTALVTWGLGKLLVGRQLGKLSGDIKEQKVDWHKKYFSGFNIKKTILPIFVFSLLLSFVMNLDVLLVKNITTAEMTGYYGALSLLGKILLWVNTSIVMVVFPTACAEGHEGKRVDPKTVLMSYGFILLVSIGAVFIYYLFPEFIVSMLFGGKYILFASDLWLFGILAFVLSILLLEAHFAYAKHNFKILYVLGLVVLLMIVGVYLFNESIREIALAIIFSLGIGYICALFMNIISKRKSWTV